MNLKLLAEKLTILNSAALESLNVGSEEEVIKKYVGRGIDLLGADFGYAWFRSSDSKRFRLVYISPTMPYTPEYPRSHGMTALAIQKKVPILLTKINERKRVKKDAKEYMQSVAVVPITYKNDTYGIFVLGYKNEHVFSPEDKDLATALGNNAAQAITINRLYSNLKDFKNTLDNTLDSIIIFNPKSLRVQYANQGTLALTGRKRTQVVNKFLSEVIDGLKNQELQAKMTEILDNHQLRSVVFESYIAHADSGRIPVEISLQQVVQPGKPDRFLAIIRDIRERKQSEELIKRMAYYDSLTGLPNRSLFTERLSEEQARAEEKNGMYGVFFIDLDRFKVVNDIYGHQVGDQLLRQVSQRLLKVLPKKATLCRMGGDEFMILLPKMKQVKEAVAVAQLVQESFVDFFNILEHEVYVNCSVGLAIYPLDGIDIRTLMKHADLALHRAKEQGGRNVQQYTVGLPLFYSMQPKLEGQLRKAIKRNELLVHYQPIVGVNSEKIIGCEALVRWNHPEMGILYPDSFIGPAEESGLIVDIGEWVIHEVSRQIQEWHTEGREVVPVSINVSPRELLRPTFVERVERSLQEFNVKPSDIKLELTETFLIKNIDLSVGILEQLKLLGLRIWIDDFGTGYASLNYLKRMPIDGVKIDRTFIQGSGANLQDAALTAAIITIAHQLGLEVVAEGVELQQQWDMLREHKCNYAQGNYFHKPMTGADLSKLLKTTRK